MTITNEEKKQRMELLHEQMVTIVKKISHAQSILDELNHRRWKLKMEFQSIDRELSMIDGRHKVVRVQKSTMKCASVEVPMKFTREQVEALAAQLGIDIDFQ